MTRCNTRLVSSVQNLKYPILSTNRELIIPLAKPRIVLLAYCFARRGAAAPSGTTGDVTTYSERLTPQEESRRARNLEPSGKTGKNDPPPQPARRTEGKAEVFGAELKERRTDGTKLPAMYDEPADRRGRGRGGGLGPRPR